LKYTDELESGRRAPAYGLSLAEEIEIYRQNLLKKVLFSSNFIAYSLHLISNRLKKKKNQQHSPLLIHQNDPPFQLHQELIHPDILNNEASMRKVRECDVRKFFFSLTYAI
jgi:hypothetical protein